MSTAGAPTTAIVPVHPAVAAEAAANAAEHLENQRWERFGWLPCRLEVQLSVPNLTVGDILRLENHSVVETRWQQNADVPIRANGQLIAWAEFEALDDRLAVRVTRLE